MYNLLSFGAGTVGDILVFIVIMIFGVIACSRGFFRCLVGFVGTVLSIVLAFLFCKATAISLQSWFGLLDKLTDAFVKLFSNIKSLNVDVSGNVSDNLTNVGVPAFIVYIIIGSFVDLSTIASGTTAAQLVAPVVANMVLLLISFLIIFILVKIICFILNNTLGEAISNIPVIKSVNAFLGFVLGVIEGLFLIYCILYILALFQAEAINSYISTTVLISAFYNHNILGYLINWLISADWFVDYITAITNS